MKTTILVRRSELKATVEVSGNGSGLIVTDSSAMARVEVSLLKMVGDPAAATEVIAELIANRKSRKASPTARKTTLWGEWLGISLCFQKRRPDLKRP
jgi:hypothetical protein